MPRNHHHYEPSKTDQILKKYDDLQEKLFHDRFHIGVGSYHLTLSDNDSPVRSSSVSAHNGGYIVDDDYPYYLVDNYEMTEPEAILRLKWLDNSPRMSRLREHRQKRLVNKLEQFELWDMEQEQKQKQYEKAREQRYNNIVERLKSQEFCVNTMRRRHESDLETTRDLEVYTNDHLYVDALDDPKTNLQGPITQYRKFEAEMDQKVKTLQNDIDIINPRSRIEQAILPRLERTRENFAVEPQIFTRKGKRILRKPVLTDFKSLSSDIKSTNNTSYENFAKSHYITQPSTKSSRRHQHKDYSVDANILDRPILKPILHTYHDDPLRSLSKLKISNDANAATNRKSVNFNDDIDFKYKSSDKYKFHTADQY